MNPILGGWIPTSDHSLLEFGDFEVEAALGEADDEATLEAV